MSSQLSPKNPEIARVRALARNRRARSEAGRFVVEGSKLVAEVLASELAVHQVFIDADWEPSERLAEALESVGTAPVVRVGARGIERMASTTTPQPVLAEVELPRAGVEAITPGAVVLVAVDLNDPGNLGTLVRTAEACGFDAVLALGSTADPFGSKAIRASAGAGFRITIVDADIAPGVRALQTAGIELVGTRMTDAEPCDLADLTGAVGLALGSEAHGLAPEVADHVDRWVTIPMAGRVESLNVAMAGTILAYEIGRQRRAR